MVAFRKGQHVAWDWGNGTAKGQVKDHWAEEVTRKIKGSEITRKGEEGNEAYLIEQEDGTEVLKLASELRKPDE
ncbi:DUF2945 domain-containing protein [Fulvimarina sp. 2208YS6-2-32]|uniref:DUF2945 domain-containing protein n=1 Tax=Fulvimarina uroteuthidis TaxID=3098149 RepID=A0ABU5I2G6_9HYPH|nr:DUF2945 domain-containing protein [Fulvimarina sp. 2208YS6-2-32]MDY8109332.1 DUF2945 domain-containing protein [Fulvimarina sp. 2208YS6-2-32]